MNNNLYPAAICFLALNQFSNSGRQALQKVHETDTGTLIFAAFEMSGCVNVEQTGCRDVKH